MRRFTALSCVLLLLAIWPRPARADEATTQLEAARSITLADPTQTSKAQDVKPQLTLEATESGTFVVGTIGLRRKGSPWSLNLQLRAPMDSSGETSLADLDGPLGDTVATLSFTTQWATGKDNANAKGGGLTPICQAYNKKLAETARKGRPVPKPIEADKCSFEELVGRKGKWATGAARARNIDVPDALCAEFNEGLGTGRLLPAGKKDLGDGEEDDLPLGYDAFCNLARVKPKWTEKRKADLRKAARQEICDGHNKKVGKAEGSGLTWITTCDDKAAAGVDKDWEKKARQTACLRASKPASCTWAELAEKAFDDRQAELQKKAYEPLCKEFNEFDTEALIDSRSGECAYRALAELGFAWEMRALRTMPVQPWYFTISASEAEPDFAFVDPETLEAQTASEDNTSLSAQLATLRKGTWLSLAYTRRTTYTPGPERDLCSPNGDAGDLLCRSVQLGAPTKTDQEIIQLDIKRPFNPRLAAIARILYDDEKDLWNPHLILYFLEQKSEDGKKTVGLRGGLDLAYNEEDDYTARLFIGTTFDMNEP